MEVKAVTEALQFLATSSYKKAVIVKDSMSTLQKIQRGMLYSDWINLTKGSELLTITSMNVLINWQGQQSVWWSDGT